MPTFKPFRGIRPHEDILESFPTQVLESFADAQNLEQKKELSYIQMVMPYLKGNEKNKDTNLQKVRNNFEELLEEKKLLQDGSAYYLYAQIHPNKAVFRGLLGLVSIHDFWDGKVKRHESTIPQKKEELAYYLEKVQIQAEPVLLTYPSNPKIELMMNMEEKTIPVIKMTDENGVQHKVWKIDNRLKMQQIKEALDQQNAFYIADGHHRMGAVSLCAKNISEKNKKTLPTDGHNFVYSFIVSNQSIKINDYNRYITSLNGMTKEELLKKMETYFSINERGEEVYFPTKKHHFSMYLDGKFYSLHLKSEARNCDNGQILVDHQLFNQYVLKEIFNIEDPDSSELICYTKGNSGKEGIMKLKDEIDNGNGIVGFGIYPISFQDIIQISDQKIIMPPKCTYIEPKLVSALVMYDMK